MNRHFIRLVGLVLVPCLLADPVTASALPLKEPAPLILQRSRGGQTVFKDQAVVQMLLLPFTRTYSRVGRSRLLRRLSDHSTAIGVVGVGFGLASIGIFGHWKDFWPLLFGLPALGYIRLDSLARYVRRAPTTERNSWEAVHNPKTITVTSTPATTAEYGLAATHLHLPKSDNPDVAAMGAVFENGLAILNSQIELPYIRESLLALAHRKVVFLEDSPAFFWTHDDGFVADTSLYRKLGFHHAAETISFELLGRKTEIPAHTLRRGLEVLAALQQLYAAQRLLGHDEKSSLEKVVEFYETLVPHHAKDLEALHAALETPYLDSGNLFSSLLRRASGDIPPSRIKKGENPFVGWFHKVFETVERRALQPTDAVPPYLSTKASDAEAEKLKQRQQWNQKTIAWFLANRPMDSPVSLERSHAILSNGGSKEEQTDLLLDEVDGRKHYDTENEARNARRALYRSMEEGHSLTVSRYGRASYFLMLLASASQFLIQLQAIESEVARMQTLLDERFHGVSADHPLVSHLKTEVDRLQGYLTDIRILIQPDRRPTKAELRGALLHLSTGLQDFHTKSLKQINEYPVEGATLSLKADLRNSLSGLVNSMLMHADKLKSNIDHWPGDRANFSVLVQRASPSGVRALNHLRVGNDPNEGGEEHIAEVFRQGGDMAYGTSDDIWFEVAQYWIESLPLFIHDHPETASDGRTYNKLVIEQESMEKTLRGLALRFKRNIDDVMDSEHVALARILLVRNSPTYRQEFDAYRAANPGRTEEQAVLAVLRPHLDAGDEALSRTIAGIAAMIDDIWHRRRFDVAALQTRETLLRADALTRIVEEERSSYSPLAAVLNAVQSGAHVESVLESQIHQADRERSSGNTTFRLAQKQKELLSKDAPYMKRRTIPTWIILTTQAPGMSDAFAGQWVDEDMALYNVTSSYQVNGKTLESEVSDILKRDERLFVTIATRLLKEFQLDYKIDELMATEDYKGKTERDAILALLSKYSDVAEEVAKVFLILESRPENERDYEKEPAVVTAFAKQHQSELEQKAIARVVKENPELASMVATRLASLATDPQYGAEVMKYYWILARSALIESIDDARIAKTIQWYSQSANEGSLPRLLRMRLASETGKTMARREVLSRYWIYDDGSVVEIDKRDSARKGQPLSFLINDPLYAYSATGANKKYNRGYGPSRVDLGNWERFTTEVLAQWIGPADRWAREAMIDFYRIYNINVHAFDEVRTGEAMKPFENSFMEASLAVSHLFMPLLQKIGSGDFQKLAAETNKRDEVKVRTGGLSSDGFCQPKDIGFPPFVNSTIYQEILSYAGVAINQWNGLSAMTEHLSKIFRAAPLSNDQHMLLKETLAGLAESYAIAAEEAKKTASPNLTPNTYLPSLSAQRAFADIGLGKPEFSAQSFAQALIGDWHGQGLTMLEDRIRFAPVHVLFLLRQAFENLHAKNPASPDWKEAVVTVPGEYKPVSDARLAVGMQMFEYMAGTANILLGRFGEEGSAIARLVLYGFNPDDDKMVKMLALKLSGQERTNLLPNEIETMAQLYPPVQGPHDARVLSVFNLAADTLLKYISNSELKEHATQVRQLLNAYIKDDMINANILSGRLDLAEWEGLRQLGTEKVNELKAQIGQNILALALEVRLGSAEYRNSKGSDVWESIRAGDVWPIIVHYPEVTGTEDEGTEVGAFGSIARMMDDLPRVADTMRDGRANSATILLDAPVQGRKTAADATAIKQWLALGGWYVSPTMTPAEVEKLRGQMQEERELMTGLVTALRSRDFPNAQAAYARIQVISSDRYGRARKEEEFAKEASEWWRGGGMNNWSVRHRYISESWARVNQHVPLAQMDLGTLTSLGLMYLLNGQEESEIVSTLSDLREALSELNAAAPTQGPPVRGFDPVQTAELIHLFIKPKYHSIPTGQELAKGESISLKTRDVDVERTSGRALANYRARQHALALRQRVQGYHQAALAQAGTFEERVQHAYSQLGDGVQTISNENYGRFLRALEGTATALINDTLPGGKEKKDILERLKKLIDQGREPTEEAWALFMGKGDDKGAMGTLALASNGDPAVLEKIAQLGGLFDTLLALMNTLGYQQMTVEEMEQIGTKGVDRQVNESIAKFFARSIYDHTFDYFPSWMHPAKSGIGFTNYDTVFGKWLGLGKPLAREKVLELAAKNHRWLNGYLDHLLRTKTDLRTKDTKTFVDPLLGTTADGQAPIGVACNSYSPAELEWWAYTQKREIAYQSQQGDHIVGVFTDLDAEKVLDIHTRATIQIMVPTGRQHTEIMGAQTPNHNIEYPTEQANVVLSRAYDMVEIPFMRDGAQVNDRMMTIPNGYMFFSHAEYVKARTEQLIARGSTPNDAHSVAGREADAALNKTPKGIPVAVSFRQPLISHFSMPLHGAKSYQEGEDEAIGLPTSQSWATNLSPGYTKGEEHRIYAGTALYPWEWQWYKRYQFDDHGNRLPLDEVIGRILHGYGNFTGLIKAKVWRLISKPFTQSGGRGALPLQLRTVQGGMDDAVVRAFAQDLADQGFRDSQVVQKMISSTPYLWASSKMIEAVRDGLIRKGIALPPRAPLFVYSRITVVYVDGKPTFVLELVVSSRMAVSNVGLGGVLYKWRKSFASSDALADELSTQRRLNAGESMPLIQKRTEEVLRQLEESPEALERDFPEVLLMKDRLDKMHRVNGVPADRTGWPYAKPRYIMHDLLDVPVVRLHDGYEITGPDILDVKWTQDGQLERFMVIDHRVEPWTQVWLTPDQIVGWRAIKIEDNIGYGLWFDRTQDEEKEERAAAKSEGRVLNPFNWGKELRVVLHSFAQAAHGFKATLGRPQHPPLLNGPLRPETRDSSSSVGSSLSSQALRRAQISLAKASSESLGRDGLSLYIKEFAIGRILGGIWNQLPVMRDAFVQNIPSHRNQLRQKALQAFIEGKKLLIDDLRQHGFTSDAERLEQLPVAGDYADHVAELVVNDFYTASAAPPLQISPHLWTSLEREALLPGSENHILIFDSTLGLTDEIHPLMAGAANVELRTGKTIKNILAVQSDWINRTDGSFTRAIVFDRSSQSLKQVEFETALLPDHVQTLALSTSEQDIHQQLSTLYYELGIPQTNPRMSGSAAMMADDKQLTTARLRNHVRVPELFEPTTQWSSQAFASFLRRNQKGSHVAVRVQPKNGTEGYHQNVHVFDATAFPKGPEAIPGLDSSMILRHEVGNARFGHDHRRVTFRLNVSKSAKGDYAVESGYAQIGAPGSAVSSISQGGQISDIGYALSDLYSTSDPFQAHAAWNVVSARQDLLDAMKMTAIDALRALNLDVRNDIQLSFAGIDLELEFDANGDLSHVWVLDVNPRPTGLRYGGAVTLSSDPQTDVPQYEGLWTAPIWPGRFLMANLRRLRAFLRQVMERRPSGQDAAFLWCEVIFSSIPSLIRMATGHWVEGALIAVSSPLVHMAGHVIAGIAMNRNWKWWSAIRVNRRGVFETMPQGLTRNQEHFYYAIGSFANGAISFLAAYLYFHMEGPVATIALYLFLSQALLGVQTFIREGYVSRSMDHQLASQTARAIVEENILGTSEKRNLLSIGVGDMNDEAVFLKSNHKSKLYGTTLDRGKFEQLASEIEKYQWSSHIQIDLNDIRDGLPYPDRSMDIVYARLSLHYLTTDEFRRALKEIHRVLKSGGKVVIVVKSVDDPLAAKGTRDPATGMTTYHDPDQRSKAAEPIAKRRRFFADDELIRELAEAGFTAEMPRISEENLPKSSVSGEMDKHDSSLITIFATRTPPPRSITRMEYLACWMSANLRLNWLAPKWFRTQPAKMAVLSGLAKGDIQRDRLIELRKELRWQMTMIGSELSRRHEAMVQHIEIKDDETPTTQGDYYAQTELVEFFLNYFPEAQLIFEEKIEGDLAQRVQRHNERNLYSPWKVVIDPIDGTKEFKNFGKHSPEGEPSPDFWMTGVALYYDNAPILAMGYAPEYEIPGAQRLTFHVDDIYSGSLFEAFLFDPSTTLNGHDVHVAPRSDLKSDGAVMEHFPRADGSIGGWGLLQPNWQTELASDMNMDKVRTSQQSTWLSCALIAASGSYQEDQEKPFPSLYAFAGQKSVDIGGHYFISKAGGVSKKRDHVDAWPLAPGALASANAKTEMIISGSPRMVRQFISSTRKFIQNRPSVQWQSTVVRVNVRWMQACQSKSVRAMMMAIAFWWNPSSWAEIPIPAGIDPHKIIEDVVLMSDCDGPLRPMSTHEFEKESVDEMLAFSAHPQTHMAIVSGGPAMTVPNSSDHTGMVESLKNHLAPGVPFPPVTVLGGNGAQLYDPESNSLHYSPDTFSPREVAEGLKVLMESLIADAYAKAPGLRIELQAIESRLISLYTDLHLPEQWPKQGPREIPVDIQRFVKDLSQSSQVLAGIKFVTRGGSDIEIAFPREHAPFNLREVEPLLRNNITQAALISARPEHKRVIYSDHHFIKLVISSKAEAAQAFAQRHTFNPSPKGQQLRVAIGDHEMDAAIGEHAHLYFHVGAEEALSKFTGISSILVRDENGNIGDDHRMTAGGRAVMQNLRNAIGKPFSSYRYFQFQQADGSWKWSSLDDLGLAQGVNSLMGSSFFSALRQLFVRSTAVEDQQRARAALSVPPAPVRTPAEEITWQADRLWDKAMSRLPESPLTLDASPTPPLVQQPWLATISKTYGPQNTQTAGRLIDSVRQGSNALQNLVPLLVPNHLSEQPHNYVNVNVVHTYPGQYEGRVIKIDGQTYSDQEREIIQKLAERTLESVNFAFGPHSRIYDATIQLVRSNESYFVSNSTVLNERSGNVNLQHEMGAAMMKMVTEGYDDHHNQLFALIDDGRDLQPLIDQLITFLAAPQSPNAKPALLQQQRALIMLGDLLWLYRHWFSFQTPARWNEIIALVSPNKKIRKGIAVDYSNQSMSYSSQDAYVSFIGHFITASNERERTYLREVQRLARAGHSGPLQWVIDKGMTLVVRAPQRAGVSSANAADNVTSAYDRGAPVLNFAINLDGKPPVTVEIERLNVNQIVLETVDSLNASAFPKKMTFDRTSIGHYFTETNSSSVVFNADDPLQLLKYALIFSGIVDMNETNRALYLDHPEKILEDVSRFTNGGGLRIKLVNKGPSRSGFASSSSCSLALLDAVYRVSGQSELADDNIKLANLGLLMELELGFKSGKQDLDGPAEAGMKSYLYAAFRALLEPIHPLTGGAGVQRLLKAEGVFPKHVLFFDSGLRRPPASDDLSRGLNMRHLAYMSRDPFRFLAVRKSYNIHHQIVRAIEEENWEVLGGLFRTYMEYRRTIDPGATQDNYVDAEGNSVLLKLFDEPRLKGLSYGGMFTGAMGGGVLMEVPTPKGAQVIWTWRGRMTRLEYEMRSYKWWLMNVRRGTSKIGLARPFKNLQPIHYSINREGRTHEIVPTRRFDFRQSAKAAAAVLLPLIGALWGVVYEGLSEKHPLRDFGGSNVAASSPKNLLALGA